MNIIKIELTENYAISASSNSTFNACRHTFEDVGKHSSEIACIYIGRILLRDRQNVEHGISVYQLYYYQNYFIIQNCNIVQKFAKNAMTTEI